MATWVYIAHGATPEELQGLINRFLRQLHSRGGEVIGTNYSALGRDAIGAKAFFSLCVTYQSDFAPEELLGDVAPHARTHDLSPG